MSFDPQSRDGGRADVVDAQRELPKALAQHPSDNRKLARPAFLVVDDADVVHRGESLAALMRRVPERP